MSKFVRIAIVLGLLASAFVYANTDIESRIKPVGDLCMAGDECAKAAVSAVASSGPRSGSDVYDAKCALCHASGAAGAPKMGDVAVWNERIAKGNDQLYLNAINGINGMPAKGLCSDCSDEEITAAVDHMISSSQ